MPKRWTAREGYIELKNMLEHDHWLLHKILERIDTMSEALDRITTEVAETKTAIDSALALISGLADQIRELSEQPAALLALADELDAKQTEIAEAVAANTPTP